MTTSHRPTLESRKGRDLQATAILHSRQVAAHRQLKYRKNNNHESVGTVIDEQDAKLKFNELKSELLQREREHYKKLKGDDYDYKDRQLAIEDNNKENREVSATQQEESYEERMERVAQETKGLDDSSDEEEDSDGGEATESSEEDDSDSDDEVELLKELEKIRKERAEVQLQKQMKEKEESAISSNPLLNPHKPIRKNWRQDKVFSYKNNSEKQKTDDDYVNDLLRSDFHQKFLNKYVK